MRYRAHVIAVFGRARNFGPVMACLLIGVMSVCGQSQGGTITLANDSSSLIVNGFTGAPVCEADGFQVALFCAPTNSGTFTQVGDAITAGWPVPGVFVGGTRIANGCCDGGAVGQFQVRAWPKSFSTYDDAACHGAAVGASAVMLLQTGNADAVPVVPSPALTANGLEGFTIVATNQLSITCLDGHTEIAFSGAPGQSYVIQSAPSINGPWCDLSGQITMGANAKIAYDDLQVPSTTRFYRAVLQP